MFKGAVVFHLIFFFFNHAILYMLRTNLSYNLKFEPFDHLHPSPTPCLWQPPISSLYLWAWDHSVFIFIWLISINTIPSRPTAAAKSLQSCPTLCDPIDGSPPGFPIPGILQARIWEWVAISFSNAWKWKVKVQSLSRVRLLSDPTDCSLPGSSVHEIFQARVLEWGAIAFSHIYSQAYLNHWLLATFGMPMPTHP